MKTASDAYIEKEQAFQRQPVELYHLWLGSTHWRYTNGDISVSYDGETYSPATISRGSSQYSLELEVNTIDVTFSRVTAPVVDFVALNPVDVLWIEILRLFRDQAPYEAGVIFVGQIANAGIKGLSCQAHCVGFEFYLRRPVPIFRYQPGCNWTCFDSKCTLDKNSYKTTTTVTLSADGLTLTSAAFDALANQFLIHGYVVFEGHKRLITSHKGEDIIIRYPILTLQDNNTLDAYAGCDGDVETCRDKFNNVINFGGHPTVPWDNPTLWER